MKIIVKIEEQEDVLTKSLILGMIGTAVNNILKERYDKPLTMKQNVKEGTVDFTEEN